MPVPQEMNFIVEQASCLFLTMVQDVSLIKESCFRRTWQRGNNTNSISGICLGDSLTPPYRLGLVVGTYPSLHLSL